MLTYILTLTVMLCVTYIAVCVRNWNNNCAKAKARARGKKEG